MPDLSPPSCASLPPPPPSKLEKLSGTVLEQRYELGEILGSGGMGAVFRARHLRLDRAVAIKVLRPAFVDNDEYVKRFLQEARLASRIRHQNVVEILDYGEASDGLIYSVMELLEGHDLHKLLRAQSSGRLPWSFACGLLMQVARGLQAAHDQGVIHRDIKPANCFLTRAQGLIKLVDFGIARLEDTNAQQLTATNHMLGTPKYIAPEIVRTNSTASPRSDIYAMGVLAYRMLTGGEPFSGETCFHLLHNICFTPVPSIRQRVPEVPASVEAFVIELLAKDPDERPPNMLVVLDRLSTLERQTLGLQPMDVTVVGAGASSERLELVRSRARSLPGWASSGGASPGEGLSQILTRVSPTPPSIVCPSEHTMAVGSGGAFGPDATVLAECIDSTTARVRRPDALWILGGAVAMAALGAAVVMSSGDAETRGDTSLPPMKIEPRMSVAPPDAGRDVVPIPAASATPVEAANGRAPAVDAPQGSPAAEAAEAAVGAGPAAEPVGHDQHFEPSSARSAKGNARGRTRADGGRRSRRKRRILR